jgi:hypothetical protein
MPDQAERKATRSRPGRGRGYTAWEGRCRSHAGSTPAVGLCVETGSAKSGRRVSRRRVWAMMATPKQASGKGNMTRREDEHQLPSLPNQGRYERTVDDFAALRRARSTNTYGRTTHHLHQDLPGPHFPIPVWQASSATATRQCQSF